MTSTDSILEKRVNIISKVPFFEGIKRGDLAKIASYMKTMTIEPDEYVLTEGEVVDGLYVIEKGFVNVIINKQVVRINIPPGESFGEMSCLSEVTNVASASVVAVDNLSALYIPKDKVKKLANEIPQLWEKAFDKMSLRLFYTSTRFSEMLNHTHLMRIDDNGIITGEMSEICSQILGLPLSNLEKRHFVDLVFNGDENLTKRDEWNTVFPLIFNEVSTTPMLDVLPSETVYKKPDGNKVYLEFKYLPCEDQNGKFNMLHVQINDITIKKMLEEHNERLMKDKLVRDRIYDAPDLFRELLDMFFLTLTKLNSFLDGKRGDDELSEIKRDLHTVKGSAGIFRLDELQEAAHHLEDVVGEVELSEKKLKDGIEKFSEEYNRANQYFDNIDNELRKKLVGTVVPEDVLEALKSAVKEKNLKKVEEKIDLLEAKPVTRVTFGWKELIKRLSRSVEKSIMFVTENTDNIVLNKSVIKKLSLVLVHLVRNSVYHGIESPDSRKKLGKDETGIIKFRTELHGDSLLIYLSDDGKGIDMDFIAKEAKRLAKENKTDLSVEDVDTHMNNKDYAPLIFISGLSTEKNVGTIAGRGVGTTSVLKTIEELKGSVKVEFGKGTGTTFIITLPY